MSGERPAIGESRKPVDIMQSPVTRMKGVNYGEFDVLSILPDGISESERDSI